MSLAVDQRIDRLIADDQLGGAFFLHGEAARLRDDAARRLADAALDPSTRDFNLDVFRGSDVTPEALASSLAMPPVMATRRVVVVHEAERLTPTGCKVLEGILPRLPADVTLIVTATIPKNSKKAFYRRMKADATSLEWTAPRDAELPGWLIERAPARFGSEITVPAATALAAAVGADLGLLDAELSKLSTAAGDVPIDVDLVRSLVANVRDVNRWDWLDEVGYRRYDGARASLPDLLATPGESAVGLLIALIEHHLLLGVAVEGGAGLVGQTLGRIGKPYLKFKTRTFAAQAKSWTTADIDHALRALERADRRAKTGGSDLAALDELLLTLRVGPGRIGSNRELRAG